MAHANNADLLVTSYRQLLEATNEFTDLHDILLDFSSDSSAVVLNVEEYDKKCYGKPSEN